MTVFAEGPFANPSMQATPTREVITPEAPALRGQARGQAGDVGLLKDSL
jgi:hypothetical protein